MNAPTRQPQPDGIPDFIGIGVQKSGTTWLSDILTQHPGIHIARKETDYFIRRYHKGDTWYQEHFHQKAGRMAGEISPFYLINHPRRSWRKEFYPRINFRHETYIWRRTCPSVCEEVARRYPHIRIFCIFRNPIDRAWSAYWHWHHRKCARNKPIPSFKKMWAADGRWIHTMGNYADWLALWQARFPDMAVLLYDDALQAPEAFAQNLYAWIGVDPAFQPDVHRHVNKGSYPPMPADIRAMLQQAYRPQILAFSHRINRDLSHWLA